MNAPDIQRAIEQAKSQMARLEGEIEAREQEIATRQDQIRELLDCDPGEERDALLNLRQELGAKTAEVQDLLNQAQELIP